MKKEKPGFVYILECSDQTLYTGSTTDPEKRLHAHNNTKNGAKYTRARRPVKIVYQEKLTNLPTAQKREAEIKKLSRIKKLQLINLSK